MSHFPNTRVALPDEDNFDWSTLLRRKPISADPAVLTAPFSGKRVLITGAGGSIGSALARRIVSFRPKQLLLLDSAEHGLYELQNDLAMVPNAARHKIIPGNVCDAALLRELFHAYRPQIVYHAAAYKHVPLMEHHPLAALHTNALGSYTLAQACAESNVEQCILLSTDKAASPSSIMGASKRVAELAFVALQDADTRMKALRLCNVLGSRGSVVPRFMQQMANGGPITITHPEVRRYFVPLRESIELLLLLAQTSHTDGIYIPRVGQPIRIVDLAHFLFEHAPRLSAASIPITFIGLRPGDKLEETLLSTDESIAETAGDASPLRKITGREIAPAAVIELLHQLERFVQARDVERSLCVLEQLVPKLEPSELIRRHLARPAATL